MRRLQTCDTCPWDIVVVPFPFTDGPGNRRRPAEVISPGDFNQEAGHSVLVMITSASHSAWPGDLVLNHERLGLHKPCMLRMKFFTLDNRLIEPVITSHLAKGSFTFVYS